MRLIQLIILILPLLLSAPVLAEEDLVTTEVVQADTPKADATKVDTPKADVAEVDTPKVDVKHGEKIFKSICIRCHNATNQISAVGCPGLKDVLVRHDEAWIHQWLEGPEVFSKKDKKAKAVVAANPYGLIMPVIPEMRLEQNRKDIIEYLKTL